MARFGRMVAAGALLAAAAMSLAACSGRSQWTAQELQTEGAKIIAQEFMVETTLTCPGALENKQGPSVMCQGADGKMWLFYANNRGELKVRPGQA